MMLLVTKYIYDNIGENKVGESIALANISPTLVQSIEKEEDTGYGTIVYNNGNVIETTVSFESLFTVFSRQKAVVFDFLGKVRQEDREFNKYLEDNPS